MSRIRKRTQAIFLLAMALLAPSFADEVDEKAAFFIKNFVSLCMKNINDIQGLRTQILTKELPKLAPENASPFLAGQEGDAWPIPGVSGHFVIAIPRQSNRCSVYARRARAQDVENMFVGLVSVAPQPLVVEKRSDTLRESVDNGKVHTLGYVWSIPGANRKMMFMLSTAAYEEASIQALATASMITE